MQLNENEQKVWDILSTPYKEPSVWDNLDVSALVDGYKNRLFTANEFKKMNLTTYEYIRS